MTSLHPVANTTLGDAYTIERELGGGGMSRVFLATDPTLGRRVVVKVLALELAQGFSAERFAREIRLAAQLQDPHIVPVLSAGTTAEGLPYYTMPYVEGESLRARLLKRDATAGPLPLPEAVSILRDVARALEYANAHGVVHRDIKPENVLLAGRTAVVADFGIAKAMSAARTLAPLAPSGGTLTSIGQSIGTPAYMAPEQVAGETVDHRADLYSWGMMAWELLAGRHPYADKVSAAQLMTAQLAEVPQALGDRLPGLPVPLAALVMQCVAKDPAARPESATAVLEALEASVTPIGASERPAPVPRRRVTGVIAGGALTAVVALGALLQRSRTEGGPSAAGALPSLAVLPFEHQGDSADAYLTDGITDEIRGKLTGVRDLAVIARASSNTYRATKKTPREIARELGVRYLLTGTVRVIGDGEARRVLVRPELVEVTKDGQPQSRWQQPVDASASDMITIQGEIAGQVVSSMEVALGGEDKARLVAVPTRDPVAHDLFLRGRAAVNGGVSTDTPSLRKAIGFYEQALARDSTMLEAWSTLAVAYASLYASTRSREAGDHARRAAERALAIDPRGAFGARAMGAYLRVVRADPSRALEFAERAYRTSPGDAGYTNNLAAVHSTAGRIDEAIQLYEQATRLDPRNALIWRNLSLNLRHAGRHPEAQRAGDRAWALAPASIGTSMMRVGNEARVGDLTAARRAVAEASQTVSADAMLAAVAADALGWVLDEQSERRLLALGPEAFDDDRGQWALLRARQLAWRGDSAAARAWGDSAIRHLREKMRDLPDDPIPGLDLSEALAFAGRRSEALAVNRDAITRIRAKAGSPRAPAYANNLYYAAATALLAGDRDAALTWLEESRSLPSGHPAAELRLDPTWIPLRNDPRFQQLLRGTP